MQDLNDKVTGGTLSAAEWNQIPSEIQNTIVALGQVLTSADLNQLGKAIAGYAGAGDFYVDVGTADNYIANTIGSKQGPPSLNADFDGGLVRFRPTNNNTGATVIDVNGFGDKDVRREDNAVLLSGDILTTRDCYVRWDNSADNFKLQNFVIASALDVPRGFIDGMITSNAADADHDITWGVGVARDSTNVSTITLGTAITKQSDVGGIGEGGGGWVAGTGNAGFPSALTRTADTWYHVFLLKNPGTGAVDAGFDSSVIATNLLADSTGFTLFLRVGSVLMDASINIFAYTQRGDDFEWTDSKNDVNISNQGTGEVIHTITSSPPGVPERIEAKINIVFGRPNTAPDTAYRVGIANDTLDPAVLNTDLDARTRGDGRYTTWNGWIHTSLTQTIKTRQSGSDASATLSIQTHGWRDPRGANVAT